MKETEDQLFSSLSFHLRLTLTVEKKTLKELQIVDNIAWSSTACEKPDGHIVRVLTWVQAYFKYKF